MALTMQLYNTYLCPATDALLDLGASAKEWKDLYVDGLAYIDGLGESMLVATNSQIQFRDTAIYIASLADGYLDLVADTQIRMTSDLYISGTLSLGDGMIAGTNRYTTTQTLDADDHIVFCDTDGGAWTLTLPAGVEGTSYKIINCGSNTLTVDPNGSEELFGAGAGVASTLEEGEIINIHYNATEGWF